MIANRCAPRVTNLAWGENERNVSEQRQRFRVTKASQILEGDEVSGFMVGEPLRKPSGLFWKCTCPAGHAVEIDNHVLVYATPICAQCSAMAAKNASGNGETAEAFHQWARERCVPRSKKGGNHASI